MNNRTADYEFTIVVPLYNEVENIGELERRLGAFVSSCSLRTCVLFVNDGSTDGSLEKLADICRRNPQFSYISFDRNYGLTAALKAGIDNTFSKYVGYIDADLQTDPEDFELLLRHIGEYSMVTGVRADRQDSFFKKMQSMIANSFRRMMTGDGAKDTGCPLKVLHTDVARKLPLFNGMHRFLPALVLLQKGGRYMEVPVHHHPRTAGRSKFGLGNRFWGPLADCFAYRWMRRRYIEYSIAKSDTDE